MILLFIIQVIQLSFSETFLRLKSSLPKQKIIKCQNPEA